MAVVDLTTPFGGNTGLYADYSVEVGRIPLKSDKTEYTGVVYRFGIDSMSTSYVDLPGHIAETDDGKDGANAEIADFFRLPSSLIQLDLPDGYGAVHAADLERAFGGRPDTPGLIINALGSRDQHTGGVEVRSVYLAMDAVRWICDCGIKVLLSDIYESAALEGVFLELFKNGVTTICEGRNMHMLSGKKVLLTALFLPLPGVTQLPYRLIAETEV